MVNRVLRLIINVRVRLHNNERIRHISRSLRHRGCVCHRQWLWWFSNRVALEGQLRQRWHLIYDFILLNWPLMNLEELLEFTIHHINCFVCAVNDCLKQLSCLQNWHLSLLLLLRRQALKSCIKVVFDLSIYWRYNILFFISDDFNKVEALLSFQRESLKGFVHFELDFTPFIFSLPKIILD